MTLTLALSVSDLTAVTRPKLRSPFQGAADRIDGLGRGRCCASTQKVKAHQGPQIFRNAFASLLSCSQLCRPVGSNEGDVNVTQQD